MKAQNELSAAELVKAVTLLQQATGIDKVRITGGEPLVTPKFDEFLPAVMDLGLKEVSLTTNGQLLVAKRDVIARSGLRRMNISLDTLNPLRFKHIARGGDLDTVLRGVESMLELGLKLKINMVPIRSENLSEVVLMLQYCLERGIELRFIELMRMGHLFGTNAFQASFVSMETLLDEIGQEYEFSRTEAPYDSTAARFQIPGQGTFGIIANESEPFCRTCTRLRLSSDGYLYGCLSNASRHRISDLLDLPQYLALPKLQGLLVNALGDKKLAFQGEVTVMKFIGG